MQLVNEWRSQASCYNSNKGLLWGVIYLHATCAALAFPLFVRMATTEVVIKIKHFFLL